MPAAQESTVPASTRTESAPPPDTAIPSGIWLLLLITAVLFALRLAGPSNLTDNDQERPASYVVDALVNGHWIVQYDWTGAITSKPPLYTWLAALCSLPAGRVTLFTLYLPCALAMFGTATLLYRECSRIAGARTAFVTGFFVLANPLTAKLVALARTDAVFTFGVALTAVLAFRAWNDQRSWIRAWLAAALATLTKGPLGLVLGFAGLAAWPWERHKPSSGRTRGHLTGAVLFLAICGGWFALAWHAAGPPLIDKMLKSELVDHAIGSEFAPSRGSGLVLAPAYFLSRFAPWSLLAFWGLWKALACPQADIAMRRLQRFAAAWLVCGLLLLGLATHQRGDLIAPLMPAGAVLGALALHPFIRRMQMRRLFAGGTLLAILLGIAFQIQHVGRDLPTFSETRGLARLARDFSSAEGDARQLAHTDTPYALQFFLNTAQPAISMTEAAQQLRGGSVSHVAVADRATLEHELGDARARLRTVARWPAEGEPKVQIVRLASDER